MGGRCRLQLPASSTASPASAVSCAQVGPLDTLTTNGNTSQVVRPLTAPGQVPWVKRPRSNAGAGWLGTFLSPVSDSWTTGIDTQHLIAEDASFK